MTKSFPVIMEVRKGIIVFPTSMHADDDETSLTPAANRHVFQRCSAPKTIRMSSSLSPFCLTLSLSPKDYKNHAKKVNPPISISLPNPTKVFSFIQALNMEGENVVDVSTSGGATPGSSRWNPTKEQINMLESLYKQGIRTPTAEQIEQITGRLKAFGHIEGKNVFYWFQNHKARQRQKQKQESMAYFNRYLHKAPPVFPPPCSNVLCSPYYLPQNELGFYPQYPKMLLPGGIKWRPRPDRAEKIISCGGVGYESTQLGYDIITPRSDDKCKSKQETLPLFPLEPTGILQARTESSSLASTSAENSTTPSTSSETTGIDEGSGDQPFFYFFPGNGSCESD